MNDAAVLENLYFQQCNFNVNEIDVDKYFFKLICHFLLISFQFTYLKFKPNLTSCFLSYSNLFGVHFLPGHSVDKMYMPYITMRCSSLPLLIR